MDIILIVLGSVMTRKFTNVIYFLFFSYIVTGSEDKKVYIYETRTGKLEKILETHPSVVHLVGATQTSPHFIVSSSIENVRILIEII